MGTPSTNRSTVPDVAGRDITPQRRFWDAGPYPAPVNLPGLVTVPEPEDSGNPKDRIGDTKPQMHLVPAALNIEVARVMADGARKYGPYNWREKPVRMTVYISAMERHLAALKDGENLTRDSGVKHLGAIAASAAILLDAQAVGNLIDDRPTPGPAGDLIEFYTEQAA
jgi:hypothetical protein